MIYPNAAMVLESEADGSVRLVDLHAGMRARASGRAAFELQELINSGRCGPVLVALGEDHPVVSMGRRLSGQTPVTLTRQTALALDGFDTLFVELTGKCNERCVHCYAGSGPRVRQALSRTTCEEILEDAAQLGFRRIQLTGGEPLFCPFVVALAARIAEYGMSCEIYSNGLLLDSSLLEQLRPHRPSFAFSVYGRDPEIHDRVTRVPGSHAATLDAIQRTRGAGLRLRVGVVVTQHNAMHIEATVAWLEELGITKVDVVASRAVGRGQAFAAENSGPHPGHVASGNDVQRHGRLCVAYDGHVLPCIFNRKDRLGSVSQRRLRDIVHMPELPKQSLPIEDFVRNCGEQLACASCRLTAYALRVAHAGSSE